MRFFMLPGGNNAGIATNSKFGSPTNFRANHRKGFSKLLFTCKFFFLWNTILLALTLRSFMSTLLPHNTIGIFSQTRTKSLCQLGTFLYVTREVTSNMMIAHCP
uniref:Uncharacterized protein n=1 Tax=Glossina pallidipes TaxID=7398 RepID=A0A1B0A1D2_GLOPL